MTKRAREADPFEVWGRPPQLLLDQLGRKDHDKLRRYIRRVVEKVYRVAYDCGHGAGREMEKGKR